MYAPNDRLEIVDVECPRIKISVPAHDIERMMVEHDLVDPVVLFHQNREISHLVDRLNECRAPDVALRIWSTLDQLPEFIAIPLGPPHVSPALENHELRLLLCLEVEFVAVQNAAMDDEIIALVKWKHTVGAFQNAASLADV